MASSIPQGLSLDEFWEYQSYAGLMSVNAAAVFGILLWDHLQILPEERALCGKSRRIEWHSPAPWAFILLRYSAILSSLCSLLYSSVQIQSCQTVVTVGNAASVIVMASSGALLCCRIESLWQRRRLPLVVASILCTIMVCTWAGLTTQFKAFQGFELPFGTNCRFEPLAEWTSAGYATSAVFLCTIFVLAVTRISTKRTITASNAGMTLINRACVLYMFLAATSGIALLVIYCISWPSNDLVKRISASYFILIMTAVGSRIFLNIQLHNRTLIVLAEFNHFTAGKPLGNEQPENFVNDIPLPLLSNPHRSPCDSSVVTHSQSPIIDSRSLDTHASSSIFPASTISTPASPSASWDMTIFPTPPSSSCGTPPSFLNGQRQLKGKASSFMSIPSFRRHTGSNSDLKSTWHGV